MSRIVVLTGTGYLAARVARTLNHAFPDAVFGLCQGQDRWPLLRRRIRRQGVLTALGQVGFRAIAARLHHRSTARIDSILDADDLPQDDLPEDRCHSVRSPNSAELHALLRATHPDVVIIFSVIKLSAETLAAADCPVINLHLGVTPIYRGMHTGYWALRRGDPDNFGSTVHLVDAGLDTGPILKQVRIAPVQGDTVATYNARLVIAGLPALIEAAQAYLRANPPAASPAGPPAPLFYEPTLWNYILGGLVRGVW